MPLTVKDILEKTFRRSFKGYNEDEVDLFLDQITDEFKAMKNEIAKLKSELAAANEHVSRVRKTEDAIMNTLVSAQKSSERIIGEATRKAELIISTAESTAKQKAQQTMCELAEAEKKIKELKGCAQEFATAFANMINAQAASFERTYKSYFGQDTTPLGGINTEALDKIDKDISRSLEEMGLSQPQEEPPQASELPQEEEEASASSASAPSEPDEAGQEDEKSAGDDKGYMELFEINKKLSEQDSEEPKDAKPAYDDYSWLYEAEKAQTEGDVGFKDPIEKEQLKNLIDEIIE